MIEIIYKEEQKNDDGKEAFFRIPNNIRQIGEIKGQQKIYIEDYAYTFLKKISRESRNEGKAAILLGEYHWSGGNSYLFITSALAIENMEVSPEHIVFDDKIWGQIYEENNKYFPQQEIVGWFISLPGFNMELNDVIRKNHLNHFAGSDKVLFVVEPGEWEEAFFVYENNQLNRQPGFYIYYEKNEPMQAYMIEKSNNQSIEVTEKIPDRAVSDFRKNVQKNVQKNVENKKSEENTGNTVEKKKILSGTWTLAACTTAAALAIGITFFNSYEGMSSVLGRVFSEVSGESEEAVETSSGQVENESQTTVTITPEITDQESAAVVQNTEKPLIEIPSNQKTGKSETDSSEIVDSAADAGGNTSQENIVSETSGNVAGGVPYLIQKGDTLTSISKNRYGTIDRVKDICELNGISPEDIIYAGQKILLPE
ncbi:MAG: LysM peptidoglycan-binding domain-containing protein [Oliverpabstia sp.]